MRKRFVVYVLTILLGTLVHSRYCHADTYAYVASASSDESQPGTVYIIDIGKIIQTAEKYVVYDEVITTYRKRISVGKGPEGVAVSPTGKHVFVANKKGGTVSMIQTSDQSIARTIRPNTNLSLNPWGVAVSSDGRFLYFTARGNTQSGLLVYDIEKGSRIETVSLNQPSALTAFSKDGAHYAYVADQDPANQKGVVRIFKNRSDAKSIDVGLAPSGIAVSPYFDYVYATSSKGNTVSVIRTSDYTKTHTLTIQDGIGRRPTGIAVISNGDDRYDVVYVANKNDDSISVIQIEVATENYTLLDTITHSSINQPHGVSGFPNGEYVFVTNEGNGSVCMIETATNRVEKIVEISGVPTSIGDFVGSISPPNAPTDLTATSEPDSVISLKWYDASYDELRFKIERKEKGEEKWNVSKVSSNITSYEDDIVEVKEGTTYSYRVCSSNDSGDSEYVTAEVAIPLKAPVKLFVTGTSHDSISLRWKDKSDAESGYEIERRAVPDPESDETDEIDDNGENDDGEEGDQDNEKLKPAEDTPTPSTGFTNIATVGADVQTYTDSDSDLESGATYVYRVAAYKNAVEDDPETPDIEESRKKQYSDWSNEVEVETDEDYACFIGTAAHGPQTAAYIVSLRTLDYAYMSIFLLLCCSGIIFRRLRVKMTTTLS